MWQDMNSKHLRKLGLFNQVIGKPYNFKLTQEKDLLKQQVTQALTEIGCEAKQVYVVEQTHSREVAIVDSLSAGEEYAAGRYFPVCDGLVTNLPEVALLIRYADCTPIVLYDPVLKVQASVHAGWRGAQQKIAKRAVECMVNHFGCQRANIIAWMGPTIDSKNYEVGQEVYDAFSHFIKRDTFFSYKTLEKYELDMAKVNEVVLLEAGILPSNIEVLGISTYTTPCLHSARRDGIRYGVNGLVTSIKRY